jgi:hypothetical protein
MSNLLKVGPLRFAALVVAALAVTAGCDSKPTAQAPVVPAEATPTSGTGVLGPASEDGQEGQDGQDGQGQDGQDGGSSGGSSGGSGSGSSGGSGSGSGSTSQWPSPEDCVSYNPNNLTLAYASGTYTVKDGSKLVVKVYGSQGDEVGDKALALAQRYRKHCSIGRDNGREDEASYVFDYWRDASGLKPTIPGQEDDCSSYDRTDLTVDDMGSGYGWRVRENDHVLHIFDNETDAKAGKLVLAKYGQICFIGDSGDDEQDVVNYML